MRHRRTLSSLAVAGLLAVAGCTGGGVGADPEPILPSSSSVEPSPDASSSAPPEPEAPTMPAAAKERTFPGAEAFVRHWVDVFNYATATGDTERLGSLDTPTCEGCRNTIQTIDDIYGEGGRIESDGWEVKRVGVNPGEGLDAPVLAARIFRSPQEFVREEPEDSEQYRGGPAAYLFSTVWRDQRWRLTGVQVLD